MIGTPEQIKKAEEIRNKMRLALEAVEDEVPHKDYFKIFRDAIFSIEYAEFWLDNEMNASFSGFNRLVPSLIRGRLRYKGFEKPDVMQLVKNPDGSFRIKTGYLERIKA